MSSKQTIITDGMRCILVNNGHPALTEITGTISECPFSSVEGGLVKFSFSCVGSGSIATALIGCFAAILEDKMEAAALGMVCFGIASELAASEYTTRGKNIGKLDSMFLFGEFICYRFLKVLIRLKWLCVTKWLPLLRKSFNR
jgi:hydroxyethylthiazole kinase-like sugar kinase family protein